MVSNNAKSVIKQVLAAGDTEGLLPVTDVGGVTRYVADFSSFPAVVEDSFTLTAADAGISVGSGSTAPAETDYQLVTPITSGLTGTVTATKNVDGSGNTSITFSVTLTNTSGSNITVSEIGYKQEIAASDTLNGTTATDRVFLLDRSTFNTITLAPSGQAAIDYTLKSVVTNNGGAEGTKSITANGTYNAIDDSLDGYSTVTVNVSPNVGTKSIVANGTYNASSDNYDGYSQVTVAVPSSATLGTKNITQNGTYNASSDNYDGYSQVTVNVSGGGGLSGTFPVLRVNGATKTIDANSGKYYLFLIICGYSTYNYDITHTSTISSVTNATFTELVAYADGNASPASSCSYRLYYIVKTDETLESVVTTTSDGMDDYSLCTLRGAATFGQFTSVKATTSNNSIPLSSSYTLLVTQEETYRGGKVSNDADAHEFDVPYTFFGKGDYKNREFSRLYILANGKTPATFNIRGYKPNDFSANNVYIFSYATISIS